MASPTVALNSPSDAGTVATLTPELKFTGTDADGDAITYEVQINTVNNFDTVIDSYSESNYDSTSFVGNTGGLTGAGQTFTGDGRAVYSAQFYLLPSGSPTGNAVAKIYTITGTFGVNAVPSGTALAVSDNVDASTISVSGELVTFTFSGVNRVSLASGTHYAITMEYSSGSSAGIGVGRDVSSPTAAGNLVFKPGTWSASSTSDACFYVNTVLVVDALSATDVGFTDITTPATTDPFTSGDQIGYTVQSPLTDSTTYYWRVRGKDPAGTNTFGAWATTQSFTVNTFTSPFPSFFRT